MNYIEKYILNFGAWRLAGIALLSALSSILFVSFGFLIKQAVDSKGTIDDLDKLFIFAVCFLLIRFIMPVGYSTSEFLIQRLIIRLNIMLRTRAVDKIINSRQEEFNKKNKGELNKSIESMLMAVSSYIRTICSDVVPVCIQTATMITAIAYSVNTMIALQFFIMMVVYVYIVIKLTQRRLPMMKAVAMTSKKVSGCIFDMMHMLSMDRAYKSSVKSRERVLNCVSENVSKQIAVRNEFFLFGLITATLSVFFCGLILVSVYMLIASGNTSYGSMIMVATFLFQIFLPMNQAGFLFRQIKMARADMDIYCDEIESIQQMSDEETTLPIEKRNAIIDITTPHFSTRLILKKGTISFLTGPNGSGKSTLAKILSGNLFNSESSLKINNNHKNSVDRPYSNILYIPQEIQLLSESIERNILHFSNISNVPLISKWLQLSGFDKSIDFTIRNFGNNLSGGQKQKLGVFLSVGQITDLMIFDEPTKGFDQAGINAFSEYIRSIYNQTHILIITHDERLIEKFPLANREMINNNKDDINGKYFMP